MAFSLTKTVEELKIQIEKFKRVFELNVLLKTDGTEIMPIEKFENGAWKQYQVLAKDFFETPYTVKEESYELTINEENGKILFKGDNLILTIPEDLEWQVGKKIEVLAVGNSFLIDYSAVTANFIQPPVSGTNTRYIIEKTGVNEYFITQLGLTVSGSFKVEVGTIASLRLQEDVDNDVYVRGYNSDYDGSQSEFYWDAISTATDNGGTIIKVATIDTGRWIRKYTGATKDSYFGLVDDPARGEDQSEKFNNLISIGGDIELTDGNTYYVPNSTNIALARDTNLWSRNNGAKTKIYGNNNKLFKPIHSLTLENIEFRDFERIIDDEPATPIETISLKKSKVIDCDYFIGGDFICENLIIEDNDFNNIGQGVVFNSNGDVTVKQVFSNNRVNNVVSYVYSLQASSDLEFEKNNIYDVNFGTKVGAAAVARVIQFGSLTNNIIRDNTFEKIVSGDANANVFYWSGGNLQFTGNTVGYVSDGGFIINEKGGSTKEASDISNNFFVTTEVDGNGDFYPTKTIFNRYTSGDFANKQSTTFNNNYVKILKGSLVDVFNTGNDAYGLGAPKNVIISGNIIGLKQTAVAVVNLRQGVSDVSIDDNLVSLWETDGVSEFDTGKRFVAMTTSSDQITRNISINNNKLNFNVDAFDNYVVWSTDQTGDGSAITDEIHITNNKVKNVTHYLRSRFNQGTSSFVIKNNIHTGGNLVANVSTNTGSPDSVIIEGNVDNLSAASPLVENIAVASGIWDMQGTASITVAHGLSLTEYRSMVIKSVSVRNDGNTARYHDHKDLEITTNSTNIVFTRVSGGFFDDALFNGNVDRALLTYDYTKD